MTTELRALELNNERLQLEGRLRQLELAVAQLGGSQLLSAPPDADPTRSEQRKERV